MEYERANEILRNYQADNIDEYERAYKILDDRMNDIHDSLYPASKVSDILINENDIEEDTALTVFVDWAKENDIIFNIHNFGIN